MCSDTGMKKVADVGFGIAGNDVQLNACFLGNACDKLRTVGSVI